MANMAMSIEEKKDMGEAPSLIADKPKYPYGLEISLCDKSLQKLGVEKAPGIGETMMVEIRVEVVGVRKKEGEGDTGKFSVDLQITDMEVEKKEEKKESADAIFYNGK